MSRVHAMCIYIQQYHREKSIWTRVGDIPYSSYRTDLSDSVHALESATSK